MRNIAAFHHEAICALRLAGAQANAAAGPEDALRVITETLPRLLGDRESHLEPGNLKQGEQQQFACGCFVVTPDRTTIRTRSTSGARMLTSARGAAGAASRTTRSNCARSMSIVLRIADVPRSSAG